MKNTRLHELWNELHQIMDEIKKETSGQTPAPWRHDHIPSPNDQRCILRQPLCMVIPHGGTTLTCEIHPEGHFVRGTEFTCEY